MIGGHQNFSFKKHNKSSADVINRHINDQWLSVTHSCLCKDVVNGKITTSPPVCLRFFLLFEASQAYQSSFLR